MLKVSVPTFLGITNIGRIAGFGFPLIVLFALPLMTGILFAFGESLNAQGWTSLFAHPQLWPALQLSLLTGLASTFISLISTIIIVAGLTRNNRLSQTTAVMLAVPHVAMAIGISFLIMPGGLIARIIAIFMGWNTPPNWVTTHDPYGLALISVLALKETPFLIWVLASILNGEDLRQNLAGQRAAALSLGHDMTSVWLRIFLPQILPKMIWPMVIVFVYAATVVDVALVIGPTQPPPMALIAWADINDAQVANNFRGAAGAWFLTGSVAVTAFSIWGVLRLIFKQRGWLIAGPVARYLVRPIGPPSPLTWRRVKSSTTPESLPFFLGESAPRWRMRSLAAISKLKFLSFIFLYLFTTLTLLLLSVSTLWSFPSLWPETLSGLAWIRVAQNPAALFTSLVLAISTTFAALVLIIAWMESQPQYFDRTLLGLSAVALGLPMILLSLGEYRAFLQMGLTGTALGLFISHLIPVTAYMFIVLASPYRSFDPRWKSSAYGLLSSSSRFFWRIKLPMLKAPLLGALAIGFAVSFGQYIPAQLIAAGRFSTLPMEAVTLTSGTNRPLTAAFALLLMLPPLLVFLLAAHFSKPRWATS